MTVSCTMLTGRPKPTLELSVDERTQLKSLATSRSLPHALVCRAKVVLWSAAGQSNTEIAERLGWAKVTVGKWRQRFLEQRMAGLYDELRPGRPRSIADERIALLLKRTLSRKPAGLCIGVFAKPPTTVAFPNRPYIVCFRRLRYSRTEVAASNAPPTRSSSRRCGTSSAFI